MGKVKELLANEPTGVTHVAGPIVLYRDKDGWLNWSAAYWFDRNLNRNGREEVGRFNDLFEALAARDAFNQMMHGKPHRTYP